MSTRDVNKTLGGNEAEVKVEPLATVVTLLFVFALSPLVLCGNALILAAMYRFKRLRTPSNYLLCSLATSDLAVGLFLPAGMYVELTKSGLCLVAYCSVITLCSASLIVMAAIAVDRFTSLAQPLRYNDLITHTSMQRYLILFWVYSAAVGFFPLFYDHSVNKSTTTECSFSSVVNKSVQIFLFCTVYGPCCAIVVSCYTYVFVLARYHARAIYTVEISVRQGGGERIAMSRYGQTLAVTVGCFLCLWMPFQLCMLLDLINGSKFLQNWVTVYLSMPIFASSAVNPWVYAYRNSEIRASIRKVGKEILEKIGVSPRVCSGNFAMHSEPAELNSFASNMRCSSSPHRVTSLLLPMPLRNGKFDKNSTLLAVPEGEIEYTMNSMPYLDQSISKDSLSG